MTAAGLRRTNNRFLLEAIEEARRASAMAPLSEYVVDITSIYATEPEASSDSDSDSPVEEEKVPS
jgi:hypothetical protein